jgi:tripartite-type tricarboxylate transporter receptor subunit TctC
MLSRCFLLALCLGISMPSANAQQYPTKPVRLIVPLSAGGSLDTVARILATRLSESLGQPVVVDNRGGGGGSIGAEITARAAPDGYTIMMASSSYMILTLMYQAPYDPVRDFAPITQAATVPLLFVINPAVAANTLSEFIALVRARPGTLNYGSSGNGSFIHLTGELFKSMTGTNIVHVPYKGIAPTIPDLISGQIQFTFSSSAMSHIKSGRLRALAITSRVRSKNLPELPSMHEAGVPGFDSTQWFGVLAPAGTQRPIVDRLQREFAAALQRSDTVSRLAVEATEPVASSPEEFGLLIRSDVAKWGKVIKDAGIREK